MECKISKAVHAQHRRKHLRRRSNYSQIQSEKIHCEIFLPLLSTFHRSNGVAYVAHLHHVDCCRNVSHRGGCWRYAKQSQPAWVKIDTLGNDLISIAPRFAHKGDLKAPIHATCFRVVANPTTVEMRTKESGPVVKREPLAPHMASGRSPRPSTTEHPRDLCQGQGRAPGCAHGEREVPKTEPPRDLCQPQGRAPGCTHREWEVPKTAHN